jgi:pimeloyl-ACP methyl ester carboxylesterase
MFDGFELSFVEADHEPYSKRAMARDQVEVMSQLGFERFAVTGHDRGGRCAYPASTWSSGSSTGTVSSSRSPIRFPRK